MTSNELRQKFIEFFVSKGHKEMPPASLIPENDPSVLFTTAGMQQFKKYYTHPDEAPAKNIVTCQPCVRTSDIDEVGDDTHLTFFEMLGNFSFGGYFKAESIRWAWEFLTSNEWLNIDKKRIRATYFDSKKSDLNASVNTDVESLEILKSLEGLEEITGCGDDNFWSLGTIDSPGGPTVEFYVDGVEVWNLVFNQEIKKENYWQGSRNKGVDTGMGLERMLVVKNQYANVYETDLFKSICEVVAKETALDFKIDTERVRIIADHLRTSVMLVSDEIRPGKNDRESVLRTLIRRSVQAAGMQQIGLGWEKPIIKKIIEVLEPGYQNIKEKENEIIAVISEEVGVFQSIVAKCEQLLKKRKEFDAKDAFNLLQQEGCPIRLYKDYAARANVKIKDEDIEIERKKHQDLSRTASAGMFKSGLAVTSETTTKYHTASHLLLAALRKILGNHVEQRGSNITEERLRLDFSHPDKLTEDQLKKVEDMVNAQINADLRVNMEVMSLEDAKRCGAMGVFEKKYGIDVKVYTMGEFSKEICAGPHVEHTGLLGHFKITKEESSSSGVRRIRAVLE